jgi:hypothetical protein
MSPPVPLSCEQLEEHLETNSEGTSTTEVFHGRACRDSSGRLRIDREVGPAGEKLMIANLVDPVARFIAILVLSAKSAHRMNAPEGAGFAMRLGWSLGKIPPGPQAEESSEDLGSRTIDGIEYQGTRTIFGSDPSQRATRDVWLSKELGLIGLVEAAGPGWKQTARVQNLDRREPDPNLLAIPPDFTIQILSP